MHDQVRANESDLMREERARAHPRQPYQHPQNDDECFSRPGKHPSDCGSRDSELRIAAEKKDKIDLKGVRKMSCVDTLGNERRSVYPPGDNVAALPTLSLSLSTFLVRTPRHPRVYSWPRHDKASAKDHHLRLC